MKGSLDSVLTRKGSQQPMMAIEILFVVSK